MDKGKAKEREKVPITKENLRDRFVTVLIDAYKAPLFTLSQTSLKDFLTECDNENIPKDSLKVNFDYAVKYVFHQEILMDSKRNHTRNEKGKGKDNDKMDVDTNNNNNNNNNENNINSLPENANNFSVITEWCMWGIENNYLESTTLWSIFSDLFECSTIAELGQGFEYLEKLLPRIVSAINLEFNDTNKATKNRNPLLYICDDLLKRLSKTSNADLRGRILIFFAGIFPLSDKSATNAKGEYSNVVTSFEKEPSTQETEHGPVDFNLYQTLWGLQQNFFQKSPTELSTTITNEKWSDYTKHMDVVLSALINTVDLDVITIQPSSSSSPHKTKPYFTKFLTSSSLMNLELKDPYFRRHLLIQMQIFIHSMLNPFGPFHPTLDTRQKNQLNAFLGKIKDLLEKSGSSFSKSVEVSLERENNWVSWKVKSCQPIEKKPEESILLAKRKATSEINLEKPTEKTGEKGEKGDSLDKSSDSIESATEKNGVDIETPVVEKPIEKQSEKSVKKRIKMGNANLDRLWNLPVNLETLTTEKKRAYEPLLDDFLKPLEEQVKKEEQQKKEGREENATTTTNNTTSDTTLHNHTNKNKTSNHTNNNNINNHTNNNNNSNDTENGFNSNDSSKLQNDEVYAWKAVRLIARQRFDLLGRMTGGVTFNLDSAIKLSKLNDIPLESSNQNENDKPDVVMESASQQREELEDGETK